MSSGCEVLIRILALLQRKSLTKAKNWTLKWHYSTVPSMKNAVVLTEDGAGSSPFASSPFVVYNFQFDLCNAGYVGYTREHLHNRVKGHKQQSSAIAKHCKNVHGTIPQDLRKRFEVLKKCRNKFDCLVFEMLFIRTLKPNLNVQSDSICAKVFS